MLFLQRNQLYGNITNIRWPLLSKLNMLALWENKFTGNQIDQLKQKSIESSFRY